MCYLWPVANGWRLVARVCQFLAFTSNRKLRKHQVGLAANLDTDRTGPHEIDARRMRGLRKVRLNISTLQLYLDEEANSVLVEFVKNFFN